MAIKAVKKSDVTKQCVPGFANQSKSVKFWSSYVSPASNSFNSGMSVNNTLIGSSQGNATAFSLNFDAQGQSSITVKYPDAGKVQLDARYDGTGNEAGLVMLGSDQFVARPVGLCITPSQGICSAGDSSCPVFKKAGDTFQIDIKAMAWESATDGDICVGNQTTPNFVLPKIALGSTLVAPNPGTNAAMGTATYNHVPASNSLNSVTQTVSEVGVFRMTATPPVAMQPEEALYLRVISATPSSRQQRAGGPLYSRRLQSGQRRHSAGLQCLLLYGPALRGCAGCAGPQRGGQTRNYTGSFAKGSAYLSVANNKDGKPRNRLRSLPSLPWLNGRAALAAAAANLFASPIPSRMALQVAAVWSLYA